MLQMQGDPIQFILSLLKPDPYDVMCPYSRSKKHVPTGGIFFWRIERMVEGYNKNPTRFTVAWDTNGTGAKCYGLYPSELNFLEHMLQCDKDKRWAYEVLMPNKKCKAYGDVDFEGPADPLYDNGWHSNMDMILLHLRQKSLAMFNIDPIFKILFSSRPDGDTIKHSFHIIIMNLIFGSNQDANLKELFSVIEAMGPKWFWNKKGVMKTLIDQSVYDLNRCMRTSESSKYGKLIPLRLLLQNHPQMQFDDNKDPKHLADCLISNPVQPYTVIPSMPQTSQPKAAKHRLKRAAPVDCPVDSPVADKLEKFLRDAGDTTSTVRTITYHPTDDKYHIQCHARDRKCLYNTTRQHDDDEDCSLRLDPDARGYRIWYKCNATQCKDMHRLELGLISKSDMPDQSTPPRPVPPRQVHDLDPAVIADAENLLRMRGDLVSKVTKVTKTEYCYYLHCDQRKQKRRCLINPDIIHDSNNCKLKLTRSMTNDVWCVEYRCFGTACNKCDFQELGHIGTPDSPDHEEPVEEDMSDGVFDVPIDHMMLQLNFFVSRLCQKDNPKVLDILFRIAIVYGKGRPEFQTACFEAYCLNCTCSKQAMHSRWISMTDTAKTGDPLDELQEMYVRCKMKQLNLGDPTDNLRVKANERYCSPQMRSIPLEPRVIAMKAQCGMGKTKTINNWMLATRFVSTCTNFVSCAYQN